MKNIIIICFLLITVTLQAQFGKNPIVNLENMDLKTIQWGYYLGFNSYDFRFDYDKEMIKDVRVDKSTGFNVGLVGDVRLNEYFNIRIEPGLSTNIRNLYFSNFTSQVQAKREVQSTYLHLPLLFKISTIRTGNIKPHLLVGLSKAINLSSNYNSAEDNSSGKFRMSRWTNYYELGFGLDLYFEYFKFTPSIRGVFGLGDELIRDQDPNSPWTGNIDKMSTRGLFVNFTFQ
jgi:hypothetical protein